MHIIRSFRPGLFVLLALCLVSPPVNAQQVTGGSKSARSRIAGGIDQGALVTLNGHVLPALTRDRDLGMVEDSKPVRLYLNLQRTAAQQQDLDSLISEQQNPASPNFHKWLTPEQFGERFGAAQSDIAKMTQWLTLQGFTVTSVAKNASVINFMTTSGGIRNTFHAQLHYWNIAGGKYAATANEPQIPAALAGIVSGLAGLNQIPPHTHHTPIHQERYDADTHTWHPVDAAKTGAAAVATPHYLASGGNYNMTPQDFYTIYNVNPTFTAGNRGAGATIAILGSGPFNYGTVSGGNAGGTATGGDVTTFRTLFGITTPLNLQIQHGSTNFPCSGVGGTDSGESALDVEWASALAPAATILFNNCVGGSDDFLTEFQALVDANVADVITSSIGYTESGTSPSGNQAFDTVFAQAAAQGQTILSAQGDSGSDDFDFGSSQGTHGLSVDYPGSSPLVLSVGGTDFQDTYDSQNGGSPQSTYWGATNSQFYGNAKGYVPEMTWNESCASPFIAATPAFGGSPGQTTATFCNSAPNNGLGGGGGGGISMQYAQPSWQTGVPGLSASITKRATPDVSLFSASGGYWGHSIVVCDSSDPNSACTSPGTFGYAGGTSFAAPQFAGILGLLRTATGSRLGLVQPAMYALARKQYTAGTACYANGQTANTGVTTGLPASTCIFNDVTTSGNNNECQAGTPNCFTNPGASRGVFTSAATTATFVDAYAAGAHFDIATGLGSVNVTNLISGWNQVFSSSTSLSATPTSITTAQSTTLKATVTGGQPSGATGPAPTLSGTVTFKLGTTTLGSCPLASGTCSISVAGTALQIGANSVTATYGGNGSYPASTSSAATVTVTSAQASQTITFGALANTPFNSAPPALSATASSGLAVSYTSTTTGVCTVAGSTVTFVSVGACSVTASQAGNASYTAATPVTQSFNVTPATQTITFGPLANTPFTSTPPTLAATASSGLAVSYASTTTPVCTVAAGKITFVTTGTCSITASQAGNTSYAAATPLTQSFNVTASTQTITFGALQNTPFTSTPPALNATASSGLAVSYASTTAPVCTVAGSSITFVAAGTCSITASQAGNANYSAATPVTQSFSVTATAQTITFGALPNTPFTSTPPALTATASSGLAVSYASTTLPVCTVAGGKITFVAAGTCSITASQPGNTTYAAATSVTQSFTVTASAQTITFGSLANTTLTSTPPALTATASSGLAVSYTSTTTSVCTVSGSTITLVAAGTCSITASQAGNAIYSSATPVTQSFTVSALDFTMRVFGASSLTVTSGNVAVYSLAVAPTSTTYPGTVTFTLSGLPAGAIYFFNPTTLSSTSGPQTVSLVIGTATQVAGNSSRGTTPWALALLALPLLGLRKSRKQMAQRLCLLLMLTAGAFAVSGCGSDLTTNETRVAPGSYTVTVTGTSGTIQHTATVGLTVQ